VLLTAVFGKIDRIASEEVTLEKMKMYPHLTICIEAFLINKSEASSYVSIIWWWIKFNRIIIACLCYKSFVYETA